jgi:tRNA(Arg) A34 adenosine deaminase TadA
MSMAIWDGLTSPWQGAVHELWAAYCRGSLPIGAVVTDEHGRIVARGRNRMYESVGEGNALYGHRLAHAEVNALIAVDWTAVNPGACALYTTMEPCALCVGAIRLARLGEVRYAAHDGSSGSIDLLHANRFMRRGQVRVVGPEHKALERTLVAMLVEFALWQADEHTARWCRDLASAVPDGYHLGARLHSSGFLRALRDRQTSTRDVVNQITDYAQATSAGP